MKIKQHFPMQKSLLNVAERTWDAKDANLLLVAVTFTLPEFDFDL